jgi:peptidoglycan/xylan/chitin deacetylase (PgdA/CDA1 family)
VPRILEVLAEAGVKGTFYVPGDTVERHPRAVAAIAEGAHELGHHGHIHLRSDSIDEGRQREEIERGLAALAPYSAPPKLGYRSPSWELTPETFAMLVEYGFAYDSSAMGDDRPYVEAYDGREILELPIHWSLDDWPYFAWTVEGGGVLATPDHVLSIWKREFDLALEEQRLVTFTMHPEVIGRGYRIGILREIIAYAQASGAAWIATQGEVAELYAHEAAPA